MSGPGASGMAVGARKGGCASASSRCTGEACANAVEHGEQDCRIHVRARRSGRDSVIDVDSAGEYSPSSVATMPETDAEGGRGRALMHALTDRVEYITQAGRTIVRLVKRIF